MTAEYILKKAFYPCSRINKQIMIEEKYTKLGGRPEFRALCGYSCENMLNKCLESDCQFTGAGKQGDYIGKAYS